MDAWLDEKLVEWKPEEYNPMSFCAHHIVASEQAITKTDETLDRLFLEMLKEAGIDCIRISIYPYHYERLIAQTRAGHLLLELYTIVVPPAITAPIPIIWDRFRDSFRKI